MKKIIWISAILILLIGAWQVKKYFNNKNYLRVPPQVGEITESVYGLGKVKTNQHYELKLGVISTVKKVYVKEGDFVQKGQRLLVLDSGATFSAPFAGTATKVSVQAGETISAGLTVIKIENLTDRYIELTLEQEGALRIQKGQVARVSFENNRGHFVSGKVSALYPKDDDFIANIDISGLEESILPGMSADVAIEVGHITGTLVPLKAVKNGILTIERDGKIQKIKIEIGLIDNMSAQVKGQDLKPTDMVLVPKE